MNEKDFSFVEKNRLVPTQSQRIHQTNQKFQNQGLNGTLEQPQHYYENSHLNPPNYYSQDFTSQPVLTQQTSYKNKTTKINFSVLGLLETSFEFLRNSPFVFGLLVGQISMFMILSSFAKQTNEFFLRSLGID